MTRNREAVKAVTRADLNLVGAMRAERKVIDKIIDELKFHSRPCRGEGPSNEAPLELSPMDLDDRAADRQARTHAVRLVVL